MCASFATTIIASMLLANEIVKDDLISAFAVVGFMVLVLIITRD